MVLVATSLYSYMIIHHFIIRHTNLVNHYWMYVSQVIIMFHRMPDFVYMSNTTVSLVECETLVHLRFLVGFVFTNL
jgi:hypothetical protein